MATISVDGHELLVEQVKLVDLFIDLSYQREPDMSRVGRMVKNYDPALLTPLEVNLREGRTPRDDRYAILDGGHRFMMARAIELESLLCRVHVGLTVEEEAGRYVDLNTIRKGLSSLDRWKAELRAGNPEVIFLDTLTRRYGYVVSRGTSPDKIQAVDALKNAHRRAGGALLEVMFDAFRTSWSGLHRAVQQECILGVAEFLATYPEVTPRQLKDRMRTRAFTPDKLFEKVKALEVLYGKGSGKRNRPTLAGEATLLCYNFGRSNTLPNRFHQIENEVADESEED